MLNDPRFHTIVRILFWGGIILSIAFIGLLLFARFREASENRGEDQGAITFEEKGDRLLVPEEDLPVSLLERLRAPSAALLPSRYEGVPIGPVPAKEQKKILAVSQSFVERWDSFRPNDQEYSFRLRNLVLKKSLPDISSRADTISLEGVCPEEGCLLGMRSASVPDLRVGDYDGKRAYVIGYGLVDLLAADSETRLYNQAYGILLYKSPRGWLVERAAGETLDPADGL